MKDRLSWLILPHTGKKNARGESNFILFEDMARLFIEKGDIVYFAVPQWTPDSDIHLDRSKCKIVRLNITGSYYVDMSLISDQLIREFNLKAGTSNIDVCITSKIFLVPSLSIGLADSQKGAFPIIYFEPGVADKFYRLGKTTSGFNHFHYMISAGYTMGYPLFLTETERDIAKSYLERYYTASVIRDFILNKSIVLPVGVPVEILDKYKTEEKNEEFTLFFGGRANDVKRVSDIVWLYDKFYASGKKVKIIICTSSPGMLAKRYIGSEKFYANRNIELHTNLDRDSYLKIASKAHVFVAWSRREGFPVGFWEQMYLGLVGVFVDEQWVRGNFKGMEYPFIFNSKEQAYAHLLHIFENYDQAKGMMKEYAELAKGFDKTEIYDEIRRIGLSVPKPYRITTGVKQLIDETLPKFPLGFMQHELLDQMQEDGRVFRASQYERSKTYRYPSNYDFYRYLLEEGYDFRPVFTPTGTEYVWWRSNGN